MSKEREVFEAWAYSKKWNISRVRDHYVDDFVNGAWHGWQAKAQAVPEGFVLVSKDTLNKALNPNDYDEAVCSANELLAVIEAQEPSGTSGCPDEP